MKTEYQMVYYQTFRASILKAIFLMFWPEVKKKKKGTSIKKRNLLPEKTFFSFFSVYFMGVLLFLKSYLKIDTLKGA